MRKVLIVILSVILALSTALLAVGCGNKHGNSSSSSSTSDTSDTGSENPKPPEDLYNGWENYSPDSADFEETEGDITIYPKGTAFGSQVILNKKLMQHIDGPYRFSFDLDATEYDTGSEIWISILGAWHEVNGNGWRTGLHFKDNNWLDVATYGFAKGVNHGFTQIVSYANSDVSSATDDSKKLFPSLKEVIKVSFELCYDDDENIVGDLFLNEKHILTTDYTSLYGNEFTFTEVEAVGFDVYVPVQYDIVLSNLKVEAITDRTYVPEEPAEDYDGWVNYKNGNATFVREEDGSITIIPAGGPGFNAFIFKNDRLVKGITGEYQVEFTLEANLTNNAESWISLIGAYKDDENSLRTGLHFFGNTWNNVACYGPVKGVSENFFNVTWPQGTPDAPLEFDYPALMSPVNVKQTYTYDADENIICSLYINGGLVTSYNLTQYYGAEYGINDITTVGFDVSVGEENAFKIKNFKVSVITAE